MQIELIHHIFDEDITLLTYDRNEAYAPLPTATFYMPNYAVDSVGYRRHIETETVWCDYLHGVNRTWNVKYGPAFQVSNACHGIVGELAELVNESFLNDEKIIDELGDVLYYRTVFCSLYGLDLTLRGSNDYDGDTLTMLLSDVGKKAAFHDKVDSEKVINKVREAIWHLDPIINYWLVQFGLQLNDVMQYNLNKLSGRHNQGKFNPNYT